MKRAVLFLLWFALALSAIGLEADYITAIASLSDPAKLATLDKREANPRLKKIVYWLYIARQRGTAPEAAIDAAQRFDGVSGAKAAIVKRNLLRNHRAEVSAVVVAAQSTSDSKT